MQYPGQSVGGAFDGWKVSMLCSKVFLTQVILIQPVRFTLFMLYAVCMQGIRVYIQ